MLLFCHNGPHAPSIASSSHHADLTNVKLHEVGDFVGVNVINDGVVHLDHSSSNLSATSNLAAGDYGVSI